MGRPVEACHLAGGDVISRILGGLVYNVTLISQSKSFFRYKQLVELFEGIYIG